MPSARYFAALTAAAAAITYSAVTAEALASPLLQAPACLGQPLAKTYSFLVPQVNEMLCQFNTVMLAGRATPGGALLLKYFGGLFVSAVLVAVYESYRPSSRRSASKKASGNAEGFGMRLGLAQLATIALALGQFVTAGLALPLFYLGVNWSTPKHWRQHHHKPDLGDEIFLPAEERRTEKPHKHTAQYNANIPRSSFLYTTVVSTLLGLVVPSYCMATAPITCVYSALSVWQAYPLYMLAINIALPPSLRRSFSKVAPTRAIVLIAALGIAVSLKTQWDVFQGLQSVPLGDVFLLNSETGWFKDPENLETAAHFVFLVDLALVFVATASQVLQNVGNKTGVAVGGKLVHLAVLLLLVPVAGPGGAIMLVWAYGEFAALRRAKEYMKAAEELEAKQGKKLK